MALAEPAGQAERVKGYLVVSVCEASGKNKDDLQTAIQSVRGHDFGLELGFVNFRE